jgi:hypothetical protein
MMIEHLKLIRVQQEETIPMDLVIDAGRGESEWTAPSSSSTFAERTWEAKIGAF